MTLRVGVERARVAVQFRDVSFEAQVLVGSAGLPSVSNTFKSWAQVMQNLPPCLKFKSGSLCCKRVQPLLSLELQSPYMDICIYTHPSCDVWDVYMGSAIPRRCSRQLYLQHSRCHRYRLICAAVL